MKRNTIVQLGCAISFGLALNASAGSIGASFLGRSAPTALLPTDTAGLVPQANWYNIDDSATSESGVTPSLRDAAGNFTSVTISYKGNDSWNSGGASDTPDARLMLGIIKQAGANTIAPFSVKGLGSGPYDVILYTAMDADGVLAEFNVNGTTNTVTEEHNFSGAFTLATETTAGNYTKFTGVTPTNGTIAINMKYLSGGNGAGLAGIQLVGSSFPANTTSASITNQPKDAYVAIGNAAGFSVAGNANNLNYQWYKNGTLIPGAIGSSYGTPPATAGDNGAVFTVTVGNNINTVTSAPVVLHAYTPVLAPGFLSIDYYLGISGTAVGDLTNSAKYLSGAPDVSFQIPSFSSPANYADNYGARVTGFITPPVEGDYDFFIRSDDASAVFIGPDANPAHIDQSTASAFETGCCNAFQEPGANQTTQAPLHLVGGRSYAVLAFLKEGGGGDFLQVAARNTLDTTAAANLAPIPGSWLSTYVLPLGVITLSNAPTAQTVTELNPAKFTVNATAATPNGAIPVAYQWKTNGVNVAGATSATLTLLSPTLADNGTLVSVVLTAPGAPAITPPAVKLTVIPDVIPPGILSVAGVSKKDTGVEVSVLVDEPLTNPDSTALSNFTLSSGSVTGVRYIENASGMLSRQRAIVLSTTGLTPGSSYTLTVKGLKDIKLNTSSSVTTPFTVSKLTWADLSVGSATPLPFIQDVVATTNGFNVLNGGNSYWNTEDDATFVYETVSGDFDKVVQLTGQDASSNWGRAGLCARESLDSQGAAASRYQQVHANPYPNKFDGTASNQGFETNRRLTTGGSTSSSNGDNGDNHPKYPNAWLRLIRTGDVIHMLRSDDGITWSALGRTDFNPIDGSGAPLPKQMFVGLAFGAENGNISPATSQATWNAQFINYGDFKTVGVAGKQTYSIGVNFTEDSRDGSVGPTEIAGTDATAQAHWNNIYGAKSDDTGPVTLVADQGGVVKTTTSTVEWTGSPNTWASTGRGEENNKLTGGNHLLMSGFLDTSGESTTQVKISNIPANLTSGKYDVVVYTLGGVASGRGGAFRVTDQSGVELKGYTFVVGDLNPTKLVEAVNTTPATPGDGSTYATGTYVVFKGLSSPNIVIEGTTALVTINGVDVDVGVSGTQRAPINAVQLVTPSGLLNVVTPTVSISSGTVTFTGTLQQADSVKGPFSDVPNASSPYTLPLTGGGKFYRARN